MIFHQPGNIYIRNSNKRRLGFHYLRYCLVDIIVTDIADLPIQPLQLQLLLFNISTLCLTALFFVFQFP